MLLHAMAHWPDVITAKFWTFAFKHTICLHNLKPIATHDNKCPYELFTDEEPPHHLTNICVFACPIYVLDKNLADDNGIPKWKLCTYCGVYVSHSNHHASNVMLVWKTKLISPQYHAVFDKEFTTVLSAITLSMKDINLVLIELLCSSKWWHQDQFAETTKEDNTQHYCFDSDWPDQEQSPACSHKQV